MTNNEASFYIGFNDSLTLEMDKSPPISEKIIKKHKSFYRKKRPFSHRTYSLKSFLKKKFCTTSNSTKESFKETFDNFNHLSSSERKIFDTKNIPITSTTELSTTTTTTTTYKNKNQAQFKKNLSYTFLDTMSESSDKNIRKINTFAGFKNIFKFSLKKSKKWIKTDNDDKDIMKEEKFKYDNSFLLTKEEMLKLKRITKSCNDINNIIPLSTNKWMKMAKDYDRKKEIKKYVPLLEQVKMCHNNIKKSSYQKKLYFNKIGKIWCINFIYEDKFSPNIKNRLKDGKYCYSKDIFPIIKIKKYIICHLRRTSNQSIDSGVTNSNTTISNPTVYKKQKSSGFDYISKALMAVSSNALTEHQNFFKWNFDKKIPDKEYILAAIPCYESEDITRNGFLYVTPKYLAYTSSHLQCYFLLTDIDKTIKHQVENDGKDFLEVILKNNTIYRFHGITDILNVYWLIYELKILKWDDYWIKKNGFTRRIKSSMKLKNYKNYFKVKHSVRKIKSLDKIIRDDDVDNNSSLNKTRDTLKALLTSTGKKNQFLDGRIVQNGKKEPQIIQAYNSFTRKKHKVPFLDLNSVKTNESDQLSLSDLSTSIDREDTSSATNSCTVSTSSPSLNDGEKCFDVSENDEENIKISYPISCGCIEHVGRKHIDSTYNIPLNIFFQILFSNLPWYEQLKSFIATSPKEMAFFGKINKANAEEWKLIDKKGHIYHRDVKFTMSFNQTMLSGKINVKEEQTLSPINNNYEYGGKLVKKVFNTGIPMADSFYIEVTYCLTRHSELQTHLQVYGNVILRKQKGFFASIKSTLPFDTITQSGLSDHYSSLNRVLSLFSSDTTIYNSLLEILGKNSCAQGIPIAFKIPFTNSIEPECVFKNELKLDVLKLEEKLCSKTYDEKSIDTDLLNQFKEMGQSIITNNINSLNLSSNKMANTIDLLNLKLDAMTKQLRLLIFILGLSITCQVFYILHFYIFS